MVMAYSREDLYDAVEHLRQDIKGIKIKLDRVLKLIPEEPLRTPPEKLSYLPARVVEAVADYYHLSNEQVLQDTSTRQIAQMRQLVMYLVRELSGWSYPIVGRQCGNYHHTTVMYGVAMVKKRCAEDRRFCRTVETLLMRLSKKLPAATQLSA